MTHLQNNRYTLFFGAIFAVLFLTPFFVHAEGGFVSLVGIKGLGGEGGYNMQTYINTMYRIAIIAAALLAVIKLILAGAKYVLSGIVTDKEDAKKDIRAALLGLLIIIAAVTILTTINPRISNLATLSPISVTPYQAPTAGPGDANDLASEFAACNTPEKKAAGYVYIQKPGTWDNPTAGAECCIPGSTGATACSGTPSTETGGVTIVDGKTYTPKEYQTFMDELRAAGVTFTESTVSLTGVDSAKQTCSFDGGSPYVLKRTRAAGLAPQNMLICVAGGT